MCLALKYSHDNKVLHRDLKTSNVFLSNDSQVKLGDFGMAKNLLYTNQNLQNFVGTPLYLPPEIINSHPYSYKADIWALGIVFYELLALRTPFMDFSYHGLLVKICNAPIDPLPETFTSEIRNFVMTLLERDPARRPAIHDLFQTEFILDALSKNPLELEIFKSMKNLQNFQITDIQLKRDFHALKTYRFSEYVGNSNISPHETELQNQETNAVTKPSRFAAVQNNHLLPLSVVSQDSHIESSQINFEETLLVNDVIGQESDIFEESPMTLETSENNKGNLNESSTNKVPISMTPKPFSSFKNGNVQIFNDSAFESNVNSQTLQNSKKSIDMKISLGDLVYSDANSALLLKSDFSCQVKNNTNFKNNFCTSNINNEEIEFKISDYPGLAKPTAEEELDELNSRVKVNMLITQSSDSHKSEHELLSPKNTPTPQQVLLSPTSNSNAKQESAISKYKQLSNLKKISSIENNQTKKFKIHNIKVGSKIAPVSQNTLREATFSQSSKKKEQLRGKIPTVNVIDIENYEKPSIKKLVGHDEYGDMRGNSTSKQNYYKISKKTLGGSNTPITKLSKNSDSNTGKILDRLAEKDQNQLLSAKIVKKGVKSKVVSYQDVNRIYRKSHLAEIEALKEKFIEKFQGKFGLVYSAIKLFVVNTGLNEIEKAILDEKKIIGLINSFNKELLSVVKNRESLMELIKLNILEIKSDLL